MTGHLRRPSEVGTEDNTIILLWKYYDIIKLSLGLTLAQVAWAVSVYIVVAGWILLKTPYIFGTIPWKQLPIIIITRLRVMSFLGQGTVAGWLASLWKFNRVGLDTENLAVAIYLLYNIIHTFSLGTVALQDYGSHTHTHAGWRALKRDWLDEVCMRCPRTERWLGSNFWGENGVTFYTRLRWNRDNTFIVAIHTINTAQLQYILKAISFLLTSCSYATIISKKPFTSIQMHAWHTHTHSRTPCSQHYLHETTS